MFETFFNIQNLLPNQTNACRPVMARPRINAVQWSVSIQSDKVVGWALTMDVTLTLVCLHHEQVGHMSPNVILVTGCIAAEYLLQAVHGQYEKNRKTIQRSTYMRELAKARSQFWRLIIEIISGVALPASFRRAT